MTIILLYNYLLDCNDLNPKLGSCMQRKRHFGLPGMRLNSHIANDIFWGRQLYQVPVLLNSRRNQAFLYILSFFFSVFDQAFIALV